MKNTTCVVTSLTANRDALRNDQDNTDGNFIAFTDKEYDSGIWTQYPSYAAFKSPRRNSRAPKILIHQFVDCKYSIWIDAIVAIKAPASTIISEILGDSDLAVFPHERRSCTFAEADECSRRMLDSPDVIEKQMATYRGKGLGAGAGLARCSVLIRRHTTATESFNNLWWSEFCRHSVRDQLSFMYATSNSNLRIKVIDTTLSNHPYFSLNSRLASAEGSY